MFSSYPPPDFYTLDPPKMHQNSQGERSIDEVAALNWCLIGTLRLFFPTFKTESEIAAFLTSPRDPETEESWMEMCRRQYCKFMTSKSNILNGKCKFGNNVAEIEVGK